MQNETTINATHAQRMRRANQPTQGVCSMSKNSYSIININTNEIINVQTSFPPCRDICRAYLTNPDNFGARLHVVKNRQEDGSGEVVFDVTSIRYSSGRVRMTLYTEFQRQQTMHEETARKAAERAATKAALMTTKPAEEPKVEEPKAEQPKKAAAKKSGKKAK